MSENIVLTLPRERELHDVAHLVVGGLAVRLDVTFENLEDLHLALERLLERCPEEHDVTVAVRVHDDELEASIGPFPGGTLRRDLEREVSDGVGLRRILDTLTDGFDVSDRDGEEWAELHKRLHRVRRDG